jgi:hypothetical protein
VDLSNQLRPFDYVDIVLLGLLVLVGACLVGEIAIFKDTFEWEKETEHEYLIRAGTRTAALIRAENESGSGGERLSAKADCPVCSPFVAGEV